MSDEETSVGHIHTPPKGEGKCCAGIYCVKKTSYYYESPICDGCNGVCHESGCFVFTLGPSTKSYECLLCKNNRENAMKRAKAKELREHKAVLKKMRAAHKMEMEKRKLKNPWDVARLKKMGVIPTPLRMERPKKDK